jgi:hypothetical protein
MDEKRQHAEHMRTIAVAIELINEPEPDLLRLRTFLQRHETEQQRRYFTGNVLCGRLQKSKRPVHLVGSPF